MVVAVNKMQHKIKKRELFCFQWVGLIKSVKITFICK